MRKVRYDVAATLDGYIAGPRGEFDWIPSEPSIDFEEMFARVDTVLLGRASFEVARQLGGSPWPEKARAFVFSRTLRQEDYPEVTIVNENAGKVVAALRAEPGDGEIWLFGGGLLFKSLLAEGLVDTINVGMTPVLLGEGIPLLATGAPKTLLKLTHTQTYPSGIVMLSYDVQRNISG